MIFKSVSGKVGSPSSGTGSFIQDGTIMNGLAEWWESVSYTFYKCFIRENRYQLLVNGIKNTIRISLIAAFIGIIIGFLLAVCSLSKSRFLNNIHRVYTDIIRGTPSVTQLMIIYSGRYYYEWFS